MTDEPTYEYVKGQGWVASNENQVLAKTKDGKEVWVIDRQPLVGEHWVLRRKDDTILTVVDYISQFRKDQWQEIYQTHYGAAGWTLIFQ